MTLETEIIGLTTIDFKELTWRSTRLLRSRAYQITNAKTNIFSDSVLCVGKMGNDPSAARKNGMQTEFEWNIFPGFTTLDILEEIQNFMEDFVSCQCTTTLYGEGSETQKSVSRILLYARRFPRCRWSFLGSGSE